METLKINNTTISTSLYAGQYGPKAVTNISLTGVGEVPIRELLSALDKQLEEYFIRDIEKRYDYYYISEDNEDFTLFGFDSMPHGSDTRVEVKKLNKNEIELYRSFQNLEHFLIDLV
jgi:hypothetical protein